MNLKKLFCSLLVASLLLSVGTTALAWEEPCIEGPYGWQYEDEEKSIVINKVSQNGVTYFVADVQVTDAKMLKTALSSGAGVSSIASEQQAVLAINGDDYGTHKYGVIIRNGELLRTHDTTRNMLIVDENGDMSVRVDRKNEDYKALGQQLVEANTWQTFEFGPELVREGQAVTFSKEFDVISTKDTRLEPRTAIGQIGPLHYILIVVDGRQDGYSVGMSLQDLQQLFIQYGAQTAMNLDGGGSAEMWFQGTIISSPSGGKERTVTDIIFF